MSRSWKRPPENYPLAALPREEYQRPSPDLRYLAFSLGRLCTRRAYNVITSISYRFRRLYAFCTTQKGRDG